jgi:hypothetical protein
VLLVGIGLAVAAFLIVRALNGDEDNGGKLTGSSANPFELSYPGGWTPASKDEVARLPGPPIAVLRRDDRRGIVIINRQRRMPSNLNALSQQLDRRLGRRFRDFQKVSSRAVTVKAGRAFLYSYVRKDSGTVHSLLVVPASPGGYTVDAVVRASARDVARQVGTMLSSFDT